MKVKNTFLLIATLFTCAWIFSLPLNVQAMSPKLSAIIVNGKTYTIAYPVTVDGPRLTVSMNGNIKLSIKLEFLQNSAASNGVASYGVGLYDSIGGNSLNMDIDGTHLITSITSAIATYFTTFVVTGSNSTNIMKNALSLDMKSGRGVQFYSDLIQKIPTSIITTQSAIDQLILQQYLSSTFSIDGITYSIAYNERRLTISTGGVVKSSIWITYSTYFIEMNDGVHYDINYTGETSVLNSITGFIAKFVVEQVFQLNSSKAQIVQDTLLSNMRNWFGKKFYSDFIQQISSETIKKQSDDDKLILKPYLSDVQSKVVFPPMTQQPTQTSSQTSQGGTANSFVTLPSALTPLPPVQNTTQNQSTLSTQNTTQNKPSTFSVGGTTYTTAYNELRLTISTGGAVVSSIWLGFDKNIWLGFDKNSGGIFVHDDKNPSNVPFQYLDKTSVINSITSVIEMYLAVYVVKNQSSVKTIQDTLRNDMVAGLGVIFYNDFIKKISPDILKTQSAADQAILQPYVSVFSAGGIAYSIAYNDRILTISTGGVVKSSIWLNEIWFNTENASNVGSIDVKENSKSQSYSIDKTSVINSITSAIATYFATYVIKDQSLIKTIQDTLRNDMVSGLGVIFYNDFIKSVPSEILKGQSSADKAILQPYLSSDQKAALLLIQSITQNNSSTFSIGNIVYTTAYNSLRLIVSTGGVVKSKIWLGFDKDPNNNISLTVNDDNLQLSISTRSNIDPKHVIDSITSAIATYFITNVVGNSDLNSISVMAKALRLDMTNFLGVTFYSDFIGKIKDVINQQSTADQVILNSYLASLVNDTTYPIAYILTSKNLPRLTISADGKVKSMLWIRLSGEDIVVFDDTVNSAIYLKFDSVSVLNSITSAIATYFINQVVISTDQKLIDAMQAVLLSDMKNGFGVTFYNDFIAKISPGILQLQSPADLAILKPYISDAQITIMKPNLSQEQLTALGLKLRSLFASHLSLSRGSTQPEIGQLQDFLTLLGFSVVNHDAQGSFGPDTKTAVQRFQKHSKFNADGVFADKTMVKANRLVAQARTADGQGALLTSFDENLMLKHGDTGRAVENLQRFLVKRNHVDEHGIFGAATQAAVKELQKHNGLTATGIFEGQTVNHANMILQLIESSRMN